MANRQSGGESYSNSVLTLKTTLIRYCHMIQLLDISEIAELQELTRKSLNLTWKNYLSNDWLPANKAHKFSVDKFYVDLEWTKMVKKALKTVKKDLRSIYDVVAAAASGGINILVQGSVYSLQLIYCKFKFIDVKS